MTKRLSLLLRIQSQFLLQREQTDPEVMWTPWDHRSVCWGGDLTLCQCAPPPITPAGVTPSATTPQTQELLRAAHELQHTPSRLDLPREATSTWQDGPLQEGPYDVREGGLSLPAQCL